MNKTIYTSSKEQNYYEALLDMQTREAYLDLKSRLLQQDPGIY